MADRRARRQSTTTPVSAIPIQWNTYACLDFVNSEFTDHTGGGIRFDRLPLPAWQRAFLSHWRWSVRRPATVRELRQLRRLRSTLRRLLEGAVAVHGLQRNDVRSIKSKLAAAPFTFALDADGKVSPVPLVRDWRWIMADLTRSAVEILGDRDSRRRLKVCANPDCSWLFYDETLNRSRRWCLSNFCGNLVKVREFRARQRRASTRTRSGRT